MSERRTCQVVRADRTMRYCSRRGDDGDLCEKLRVLAQQRRRFGYRRLHILLRREGLTINRKKTQRLYREEGLTVRRRKGANALFALARSHRSGRFPTSAGAWTLRQAQESLCA